MTNARTKEIARMAPEAPECPVCGRDYGDHRSCRAAAEAGRD
jgi:hypothetical protein